MRFLIHLNTLLALLLAQVVWTQGSLDSIKQYTYEELEIFFERETEKPDIQYVIASEYLSRVKKNPDSLRYAKAYAYLSEATTSTQVSIAYADSSILFSKNLIDHDFPAKAYYEKSGELYYLGEYDKCFDALLLAKSSAENQNSDLWKLKTSRMIGYLMSLVGNEIEAKKIYMGNFQIFEKNLKLKDENPFTYNNTLFNIATTSIKLKSYRDAKIYTEKGLSSSRSVHQRGYARFLNLYSLIKIEEEQFQIAIDSLETAKSYVDDDTATNICTNYILAYAYLGLNNEEKAFYYLDNDANNNVNHLKNRSVLHYRQIAYSHFINYYRKTKNVEQELRYVLKKNKVDSTIVAGQISIANAEKIIEKIELLDSKSSSINELQKQNKDYRTNGWVFGLLCLFSLFGLAYSVKRSNDYKHKFEALMLQNQKSNIKNLSDYKINKKTSLTTDIHEDVINQILSSLNTFEESKKYTDNSYTLDSLAKEFNTNKSYLSKVINEHKQMNFSNYLNNLRIGYIVEELKVNSKLRSYTIKAIAEESGFNTSQSFSKAFHKRTGIYPSYFIKKINSTISSKKAG